VPLQQPLLGVVRATIATLALAVALIAVGLTAPADGPFSIALRPVFLRLGVDLDVKVGSVHLHASWSALPDPSSSTNSAADRF
jgi:hypothetical protein